MNYFSDEIDLVCESVLLSTPNRATLNGLRRVSRAWRDSLDRNTYENQIVNDVTTRPYDVVFGVLVARFSASDVTATTIRPPREAGLRVIPDEAFPSSFDRIASVDLSLCDTLVSVGARAFKFARIATLNLSGVTALEEIGDAAFAFSPLVTLQLSACAALRRIGEYAFYSSRLTTLVLSDCTALEAIEKHAFSMSVLTDLDLKRCVALQTLGPYAFQGSPLTHLDVSFAGRTLPLAVGHYCFASSKIPVLRGFLSSVPANQYRHLPQYFPRLAPGDYRL